MLMISLLVSLSREAAKLARRFMRVLFLDVSRRDAFICHVT